MSSQQRAPKSTLTGHHTPVQSLQQVAEDEEMQRALLLGNAAMQSEGPASDASDGGWAGELLGDVMEWGWEQIGSAEAFARYLAVAGEAAAKEMAEILLDHAPEVLDAFIASVEEVNAFTFWLLERIGELDVASLEPARRAIWLFAYVQHGSAVLLRALLAMGPAALLETAREAGEGVIEQLMQEPGELGLRLLDAAWTPGVAVGIAAGAGAILGIGVDGEVQASMRHTGRGAFSFEASVEVGGRGELGGGAREGQEEASASLVFRGFGTAQATFAFPDLLTTARCLGAMAVLSGAAGVVEGLTGLDLGRRHLTSLMVGDGVEVSVDGALGDVGEVGLKAALKAVAGVEVSLTDLVWDGPFATGASVAYRGQVDAILELAAALPELAGVDLGTLDQEDAGVAGFVVLHGTVAWDGASLSFSDLAVEVGAEVDGGEAAVEASVGLESVGTTLDALLDAIAFLRFHAEIPCDELAAGMVEGTALMSLFEAGRIDGLLTVDVELAADDARAMAEMVVQALRGSGSRDLASDLQAWLHDPVGMLPPTLVPFFATELSCSASLQAVLNATIDLTAEAGLEIEDLGKLGVEGMLGLEIDVQKDILALGGKVLVSDIRALLTQGEAEAHAA